MQLLATELAHYSTPGPRLAAWVTGDPQATPVLFLHGTSANGRVWDDVIGAIRTPVRAIAIDQRGHGLSEAGPSYDAHAFAADTAAVLEQVGIPALVVGHSMGARNAWVLAAHRPELVRGVIAVDYTPFVETEVLDALDARVKGGNRTWATLDEVRGYLRDRYPRLPEEAVERRAEFGYLSTREGLRPRADPCALAQLVEGLRTDYPEEYASLAVPMIALRGEDSLIVSPAAWAAATRLAPHVEAVTVRDADHYVHEEQPSVVAQYIDRMLNDNH